MSLHEGYAVGSLVWAQTGYYFNGEKFLAKILHINPIMDYSYELLVLDRNEEVEEVIVALDEIVGPADAPAESASEVVAPVFSIEYTADQITKFAANRLILERLVQRGGSAVDEREAIKAMLDLLPLGL